MSLCLASGLAMCLCLCLGEATNKRSDDVDVGALQVLVQQQAATIIQLQSRLTALEHFMPSSFQQVGFTAGLSTDLVNLRPGEIIKFDVLGINFGNGYSALTGIFTAPVSGLYSFTLSFMSVNGYDHSYITIDKHGTVLGTAFADGRSDWDQGSTQVTTHLTQGEQVVVRPQQGTSAIRGGWNDLHTSSFSGFLVQAD